MCAYGEFIIFLNRWWHRPTSFDSVSSQPEYTVRLLNVEQIHNGLNGIKAHSQHHKHNTTHKWMSDRNAFPLICLHIGCVLIWHVLIFIVAAAVAFWRCGSDSFQHFNIHAHTHTLNRSHSRPKKTLSVHYIEVLIFIYLSFVRLLLYNKHLIDV